jgi:aryl-alcohol dehydrogenase-like predicted oxidoreductase
MDFVTLGRTGEKVSVVGLGCGGHSRLGMTRGASTDAAADIVRAALDLGVTFIDTAEAYGTEEAVGLGVAGRRDEVFISTKALIQRRDGRLDAPGLRGRVEKSLQQLATDRIDLFNLHGITLDQYEYCLDALLPELNQLQAEGKVRFLGITEHFDADLRHGMLGRAIADGQFDVVMVGFNLLNPSARRTVFPTTQEKRIGTLIMFAVRRALSQPQALRELLERLEADGAIPPGSAAEGLVFVERDPTVRSLVEAAYRFCRHEPGAEVILTGTGEIDHLRENVASILAPSLPTAIRERLSALFGDVCSVSGN